MQLKLPPGMLASARRSLLFRGAMNQLVCLITSVMFWVLSYRDSGFIDVATYSFVIGNLIWLFIDGGRALLSHLLHTPDGRWPGLPAMAINVMIGTLSGYALGMSLVSTLLAHPSPSLLPNGPSALLSLLVAVVATYYFYSRERLHVEMAAAEAARRQAIESQLGLLQSQLEPHMLFNTLANLRVLIGLDPPRAQAMLDHLIGFLRVTLSASRVPRHPLGAEFDRMRDYLALMAVRMGPRLQVQLDLPAELADLQVPPLLLQPLVENSIKHGLEPKVEGGRIEVSARLVGDKLRLIVLDSGVGLAAAVATDGSGFGTTQVRERLAALYGNTASLTLVDAPGGGTLATIELPAAALHGTPAFSTTSAGLLSP